MRRQNVASGIYGATIKRYAGRYGLDWRLVLAIMKQESGFSRSAESHKGAGGLMQLMPVTGEELARNLELEDISHPDRTYRPGYSISETLRSI